MKAFKFSKVKILTGKISDTVFNSITTFFSGSPYSAEFEAFETKNENLHNIDKQAVEWELHQEVQDIVLKDITVIMNKLTMVNFGTVLQRVSGFIFRYFHLHDQDAEIVPYISVDKKPYYLLGRFAPATF